MVFDALRIRLLEMGEAVKDIGASTLAREPGIPWADVAGLRDRLAHRYFDVSSATIRATIDKDLPALEAAVRRIARGGIEIG